MGRNISLNTHSSLRFLATVGEQYTHIFEPVARQVVHWIIKDLGQSSLWDNDWISFTSDHNAPLRLADRDRNVRLQMHDRVDCVIRTNMDVDTIKWPGAHDRLTQHIEVGQTSPILFDADTSTILSEWLIQSNLIMSLTLTVVDRSTAHQLMDAISMTLSPNNPGYLVDFTYDYPIPLKALGILLEIFRLKGLPDEVFVRSLEEYSARQLGTAMNTVTTKHEIVRKRSVEQAMAQIDMSVQEPNVIKSNQRVIGYSIPLEITLQFMRPQAVLVEYPIIVNNQHIPEQLIDAELASWPPGLISQYDQTLSPFLNIAHYQKMLEGEVTRIPVVKAPCYDPWVPNIDTNSLRFGYQPFLIMAITLDTDANGTPTGTTTIDLANLGDITLIPEVLAKYAELQGQALYYQGMYNVAAYANDVQIEPGLLTFDGQTLTLPHVDTNRVYRLIFSVKEDLLYASLNVARVIRFDIYPTRRSS